MTTDTATAAAKLFSETTPRSEPAANFSGTTAEASQIAKLYSQPAKKGDFLAGVAKERQGDKATADPAKPDAAKVEPGKPDAAKPEPGKSGEAKPEAVAAVAKVVEAAGFDPSDPISQDFAKTAAQLGEGGAQKLLQLQQDAAAQQWKQLSQQWADEAMKLPKEDLAAARAVVREHGSPELIEVLERFHLGNHPAVVKFMASVGRNR